MKLFYGIVALLSVMLAFVCLFIVRKKNLYLSLLFVSVAVCNTGYFMLSVSKTLPFAIVSNDIAYSGSVFLPFLMLMMIFSLCGIKISKKSAAVFICIGVAVLFIAVTPGILPIYYKSAVLETVNGATALVKEYGPLHFIYALYVALYFVGMICVILYSIAKKTAVSLKYPVFLLVVVLGNIAIWVAEKCMHVRFEFLSVSYIMTEGLLLLLYGIVEDYEKKNMQQPEEPETLSIVEEFLQSANPREPLTDREREVLGYILENEKRKIIAEKMCISENTVKTHTTHIFEKLGVSGRAELFEMAHKDKTAAMR